LNLHLLMEACNMKPIRSLLFLLLMTLFSAPLICAQGLAKYRTYAFGMSPADLQLQLGSQALRAKLVHDSPATIQELAWWPWESPASSPGEGLWQVLFRFHDGQLYRILATYDRQATRGLTAEDMIEAISTQYGPPTRLGTASSSPTNGLDDTTKEALAQWEDAHYSHTLFRSSLSDAFGLVMLSKQLDAQADLAIAEFARLAMQNGSRQAAVRRSQEAEDLEAARQRNKKAIRP
jgi:hypothetical protein